MHTKCVSEVRFAPLLHTGGAHCAARARGAQVEWTTRELRLNQMHQH